MKRASIASSPGRSSGYWSAGYGSVGEHGRDRVAGSYSARARRPHSAQPSFSRSGLTAKSRAAFARNTARRRAATSAGKRPRARPTHAAPAPSSRRNRRRPRTSVASARIGKRERADRNVDERELGREDARAGNADGVRERQPPDQLAAGAREAQERQQADADAEHQRIRETDGEDVRAHGSAIRETKIPGPS